MKRKRKIISALMTLALVATTLFTPATVQAAEYSPVYVTDANGTTCTGTLLQSVK